MRGLVLSPDIAGLRPLFDDLCAQLSEEHGWAVIAPEPSTPSDLQALVVLVVRVRRPNMINFPSNIE